MIRVFLAGEGPNELGGWARPPSFRQTSPDEGVLVALLREVRVDSWEVKDAVVWRGIRKFRVRPSAKLETQNVLGAVLAAKEAGCDVLVFSRDRDDSNSNPNEERQRDVEAGIDRARELWSEDPAVVGGMAIRKLESWLVALTGKGSTETLRRPEEALAELGVGAKDTAAMVALVHERGVSAVPRDAASLGRWLDRVREVLS